MTEPAVDQTAAAGFVLAGGRSSRMGVDKALIALAGKPLIQHALEIQRAAGLDPSIAGSRTDLSTYAPVIPDDGFGPLSGICAALTATAAEFAVFVPVDAPLIPSALIQVMLSNARAKQAAVTVASVNGFAETFPAVLHRSVLPALQKELSEGRRGCFAAFQIAAREAGHAVSILPVESLLQSGQIVDSRGLPPSIWFLNVNRPGDLEKAEATLTRVHRVI